MTTICAPQRQTHRPPAAVRKAKREAQRQADQLTDQIMTGAQQQEVLAKAAAALTQGYLTQAEVLAWQQQFNTRLDALLQHSEQNLGFA
jgi:septation ring formation regulator EzrA